MLFSLSNTVALAENAGVSPDPGFSIRCANPDPEPIDEPIYTFASSILLEEDEVPVL